MVNNNYNIPELSKRHFTRGSEDFKGCGVEWSKMRGAYDVMDPSPVSFCHSLCSLITPYIELLMQYINWWTHLIWEHMGEKLERGGTWERR